MSIINFPSPSVVGTRWVDATDDYRTYEVRACRFCHRNYWSRADRKANICKTNHTDARFWAHVTKTSTCWTFSPVSQHGYGSVRLNGRTILAHRYLWARMHGPIPDGLFVCHHCDNPSCVRPEHLFVGSRLDNIRDAHNKGRHVHGTKFPQSKLTEAIVTTARAEYTGRRGDIKRLAIKYGVNEMTMAPAIFGETWKHVPGVCVRPPSHAASQ